MNMLLDTYLLFIFSWDVRLVCFYVDVDIVIYETDKIL